MTVGTDERPFDRLIRAVAMVPTEEKLFVQHGPSQLRPKGAICADFLDFDEMAALMNDARVVVSHAGVGSVALALRSGKRPVIMPRRHRLGEHVDDHQVLFARRLATADLAVCVEDALLMQAAWEQESFDVTPRITGELATPLASAIRQFLLQNGSTEGSAQ